MKKINNNNLEIMIEKEGNEEMNEKFDANGKVNVKLNGTVVFTEKRRKTSTKELEFKNMELNLTYEETVSSLELLTKVLKSMFN